MGATRDEYGILSLEQVSVDLGDICLITVSQIKVALILTKCKSSQLSQFQCIK